MPSAAHVKAHSFWTSYLLPRALSQLTPDFACSGVGSTSKSDQLYYLCSQLSFFLGYRLGSREKEADAGIEPHPNPSNLPSIVMEVGVSETLTQLRHDARHWLENSDQVFCQ